MSETSTETPPAEQQPQEHQTETKPSESAELGDAGKRAIAEERNNAKAAEKRARAAEAELEAIGAKLARHGFDVDWSQRHNADGFQRFHVRDPFGNRVEIVWQTGD